MAANFYPDRITSSLYSTFEVEIYDRDWKKKCNQSAMKAENCSVSHCTTCRLELRSLRTHFPRLADHVSQRCETVSAFPSHERSIAILTANKSLSSPTAGVNEMHASMPPSKFHTPVLVCHGKKRKSLYSTTCLKNLYLCLVHTDCTYWFRIILWVNRNYFLKQH
jgi:hypothetical protein